MCKAEETNMFGMHDYSACKNCALLNNKQCPYKMVKVNYEVGTWVRE